MWSDDYNSGAGHDYDQWIIIPNCQLSTLESAVEDDFNGVHNRSPFEFERNEDQPLIFQFDHSQEQDVDAEKLEQNELIPHICKQALQNGWIKVSSRIDELRKDLSVIAEICGLSNLDNSISSQIKLCSKVKKGTNQNRDEFEIQLTKESYLENAQRLLKSLFLQIDNYSNYNPPKTFSVIELLNSNLKESRDIYESFAQQSSSQTSRQKSNRCRAFRTRYLPKKAIFLEHFGFDITRLVKGGGWGSGESKDSVVHLKAISDLILNPSRDLEAHSFVKSGIIGAIYVVASFGEHNPKCCYQF
jgi:hypothetical protein